MFRFIVSFVLAFAPVFALADTTDQVTAPRCGPGSSGFDRTNSVCASRRLLRVTFPAGVHPKK